MDATVSTNSVAKDLQDLFPIWNKLTPEEQQTLTQSVIERKIPQGTVIHKGSEDCLGLYLVKGGLLRAYILSEGGKEITVYRLYERDMCLFSASCMLNDIQFDIWVEADKDTDLFIIPTHVYRQLMQTSLAVANFTNQLMASRFSEVMWLIEQILFQRFDKRLADFLLEQSVIENSTFLPITHEKIARHLGTAREVVTRMLKYFHTEQMVLLSRGGIQIANYEKLNELSAQSKS